MEQFKVLVKCLTYNHSKYIEEAMKGFCIQQTDFPYVCVIVDDASTDGEQNVIKEYLKTNFVLDEYDGIKTVETDEYASVFARHIINANCYFAVFFLKKNHYQMKKSKESYFDKYAKTAEYVAFCEGDDYWIDSEKLQKQVSFLDNNPSYVMSHTGIKYFYEYERKFYESKDIEINVKIQKDGLTKEKLLSCYRIQTVSVVVLSKALFQVKLIDPFLFGGYFLMGDTQLWYSLLKIGKIHFLSEITCVYRKNEGSATKSTSIEKSLRFSLSSKELRLYLARKDNLTSDYETKAYKDYEKALKWYMYYKPDFVPLFPINSDKSSKSLCTKWVPLLKMFYYFVHIHKSFLGYMRRRGKLKI